MSRICNAYSYDDDDDDADDECYDDDDATLGRTLVRAMAMAVRMMILTVTNMDDDDIHDAGDTGDAKDATAAILIQMLLQWP